MTSRACPECGREVCIVDCPGEPVDRDPRDCGTCGLIGPCEGARCVVHPFVD